jgi:hypothetical protein
MQCKDIPEIPILEFLYLRQGEWCNWFSKKFDNSVRHAFPDTVPDKIILRKMQSLQKRGLVGGCSCGCRGDYEITDKGLAKLGKPRLKPYNGY